MRVLSLATVFPSPIFPNHGLFVYHRLRRLAELADVRVVAPISFFRRAARKERGGGAEATTVPIARGHTFFPNYFYIPRALKRTDAWALALSVLPRVARLRRTFDFDVIDAHFGFPEGAAAVLLGRIFRRPVVITLRGTEPWHAGERGRGRALARALKRAAGVVAVGSPLADLAIALGAEPEKVRVIPNGVDPAIFHPVAPALARRALGIDPAFLPPGAKLAVGVGHLCPRKGFERLVAAVGRLSAGGADVRAAIVGGPGLEGDSRESIAAAIRERGLEKKVLLPGPAGPARVALWHAAADVSVLASDHEGCPNVVLEALACGAPVVATEVGNVRDLIVDPGDGLVVRPKDTLALAAALGRALSRPWDREAIAARAAHRTWQNVAREHLAALEAARDRFAHRDAPGPRREPAPVPLTWELRAKRGGAT